MAGEYLIEEAGVAWAEEIARFQVAMALETEGLRLDPEVVRQGVRAVFETPERGRYLVARHGNGVAGCLLALKEWSDWRNAEVWWVHSVYVLPEHRGRGVFRRMFERLESLARASGVRGLRLYVDRTNRAAQEVYCKLAMNGEHYLLFEKMF